MEEDNKSKLTEPKPKEDKIKSKVDPKKVENKFYLSTAINYTNGAPHFGHAYEAICADVITRFKRIDGKNVFFMTGSDEHGQKVAAAAEEKGLKPIELCDHYVALFKELNKALNINNDFYIRTTMPEHEATSQWLWRQCEEKGDIYLGVYEGWYNVREEKFVTDKEAQLSDFKDPGSGKPLIKTSEPSYFFKMSKYQDRLLDYIKNSDFIYPESSKSEVLGRLIEPLQDLSISRTTFDWGVVAPVSHSEHKHVMYVWFDALTNYITGVNYPDGERSYFWPADIHLIGKDISWFHCVIWPIMLLSAGIPLPKQVVCHGFVLGPDGRKMSKSYGNVVDPKDIYGKYSVDNLRYFVVREGIFGDDFSFSENAMIDRHDAELADDLGNLIHRCISLCQKWSNSNVPEEPIVEEIFSVKEVIQNYRKEFESLQLQNASGVALETTRVVNRWLATKEPWKLKGEDKDKEKLGILRTAVEALYIIAHLYYPFIPTSMDKLFLNLGKQMVSLNDLTNYVNLQAGSPLNITPGVFFEKIKLNRFEKKKQEALENKPKKNPNEIDVSLLDLRVGKVLNCKKHEKADNLYVLEVDINQAKPRQIVSGLANFVPIDQMVDQLVIVVSNLKHGKLKGVMSEGLVITAENADRTQIEIVNPPAGTPPGTRVTFEGYDEVSANPNLDPKKKFSKIKEDLKTNENGVACYKNIPFTTPNGVCVAKTLKNSQLG